MEKAIVVKGVSKRYKLYKNSKERILDIVLPKKYGESFYALSDIDFIANRGEVIGFVGINGSGKSTLSNIIAGIVPETSGTVQVNGQVAIIAVSAGLKGDLTGRDNIELKLLMLGFNKKQIEALEQDIIDYSELGDFIDQPVKSYSSGMRSRLGFSISVNVDPDILIIDEALSVGDKAFAEKSLDKMKEFKARGKTMIFVSHSVGQMKRFCDKILWIEYGRVKEYGAVKEVMPKYELFIKQWKKLKERERATYRKNALMNRSDLNEEILVKYVEPEPIAKRNSYMEKPISRIARIRNAKAYIYESPKDLTLRKSSEEYQDETFYVKKLAKKNTRIFYLLSKEPSAVDGVIGWVEKSQTRSYPLTFIDQDEKEFAIKGEGAAYDIPWGMLNNKVVKELASIEHMIFKVQRTERVNQTLWYYGAVNDQKFWITKRYLKREEKN